MQIRICQWVPTLEMEDTIATSLGCSDNIIGRDYWAALEPILLTVLLFTNCSLCTKS